MKICGIYKITSPTKNIYIGQSININSRFKDYCTLNCKAQSRLYNSLKKYGAKNHKFEILCECKRDELNDLEIYYIELYQCFNSEFGMNLQYGGNNHTFSDETKNKISLALRGRIPSPATIEKRRLANIGKKRGPRTQEVKDKISKSNKGKQTKPKGIPCSEETKQKLRISSTGYKHSSEAKEKIRLSKIGKSVPMSEHTKIKLSKIKKGKKWTLARIEAQNKRFETRFINPRKQIHILQILDGKTIKEYVSISQACRENNICYGTIKDSINNKLKKHSWAKHPWKWELKK